MPGKQQQLYWCILSIPNFISDMTTTPFSHLFYTVFQHSFSSPWQSGHIASQKMVIIQGMWNGKTLGHRHKWVIMMIGSSGLIKHTEGERLTSGKKIMVMKMAWVDSKEITNVENAVLWKYLVSITVAAAKDACTKWIITAHGQTIASAF